MTIRQRYYLSLIAILALFAVNLVAYLLSARQRTLAESEWDHATAAELRISSISQGLSELNRLAELATELNDEYFIRNEAAAFEEKADSVKSQIENLLAGATPDQRAEIQDFYNSYLEMRQGWLAFYRMSGKEPKAAIVGLIVAQDLWPKLHTEQIPRLQALETSQASRARAASKRAEWLSNAVMLATFSLSVMSAIVLSYSFSRRLTFGLTTLARGANLIGAMRLNHRISYHLRDEFTEVAGSFNAMSEKLSMAQKDLLETNRQLSESETRYRTLVNRAVYGIYSCTEDGRFLDANPALIRMLGYASKAELFDLDMTSDVYKNPVEYAALLEKFKTSGSIEGVEIFWRQKTGETIIARLSGNVVTGHRLMAEYEMIAENVTQHRALEDQFRQAQKMEAIGRLAGGIAHDFNNLLTVIKGHCELIRDGLEPGSLMADEIEGVGRAADRAGALTRQLLAFSRRQLLTPKTVDLNSIVTNMEQLLGRLLGEDVRLRASLDPETGAILADPNQIEQVIMNLAVNARDAMPDGGELWISTSKIELKENLRQGDLRLQPGSYAALSVSDTGQGMDALTRSRAFEPFFTTKEPGKGTGLGLSTVYGIVKQSNGEVWLDSAPGQGTTFHIYFPRVAAGCKTIAPRRVTANNQGKETILIVEDEEDVRNVAVLMLRRRGYSVLSTGLSEEAKNICRTHEDPIHLLLTDVVLQETGGLDLAQTLMQMRPEMKVIYMSGYTEDMVLQHGIMNSQVAFVPKPFTTEELASKVREVLDQPGAAPLFIDPAFKS